MAGEICLERRNEQSRPGQLYGFLGLGVRRRDLDQPLIPQANERVIEDEPEKIAQAKRTRREQRDHEAVTVEDRLTFGGVLSIGSCHKGVTEVEQLFRGNQPRALCSGGPMSRPDPRNDAVDPGPISMRVHHEGSRAKFLEPV